MLECSAITDSSGFQSFHSLYVILNEVHFG